jgi:hypothetical protein
MPAGNGGWRIGRWVAFFFCVNRERQGGPKEATMKRITNYVTTAAAVLIMTAGVASAQSIMKAEVPFAFHVGGNVMEPGTIRVQVMGGNTGVRALTVNNYEARRSYIVLPKSVGDAPKSWVASGVAKLGFDCSSGTCILAKAWNGAGNAYEFYRPKNKGGETLLTEIVMTPDRGN